MVETLAKKTNGEILLGSRRGKTVTRAVQVRVGCRVEEYMIRKLRSAFLDIREMKDQDFRASSLGDW